MALLPVSIIFVLYQTSSYNFLLIGRSLAGILYGVTLITLILHIADNSSQFMRRYFIWTISTITIMPTILLVELVSSVTSIRDTIATIGVIMFVLAILTLIFMPCTYDSIIFLLESGMDLRALEILLKLRNESRAYIRRDFNEFKMQLAEDCSDDSNIFGNGNSRPLFLIILLRLLNAQLSGSIIYWIFLALIWFDYRQWALRPMNLTAQMLAISQDAFINESEFNSTFNFDGNGTAHFGNDNSSSIGNSSLIESFGSFNNKTIDALNGYGDEDDDGTGIGIGAGTLFLNEDIFLNATFNGTETDSSVENGTAMIDTLMADDSNVISMNFSSFADHLFTHSAYSYRLPQLQIAELLFIAFLIKCVAGMPLMCLAEKFQIYRNRIIFKLTLFIGIINVIFFTGTLICYRYFDDSSLLFTFYMAKLLNLIYGSYLIIIFAVDTIGYGELAESFSLTKRYGSIAFITICEQLFHCIVLLTLWHAQMGIFYFHLIQSVIICILCYFLLNQMPNECLDSTLRNARDKYFIKMASTNT